MTRVRRAKWSRSIYWWAICGAVLSLLLHSTAGRSQSQVPVEDLQREWVEIQTTNNEDTKRHWWRDLNLKRLDAFFEAGVDVSITNRRGWTPLHSAARYNLNLEILTALLQAGAVVDAQDNSGNTPLHWAAAESTNVDIIHGLLQAGANVNAKDNYGWLPIHTAAEKSSNPAVIDVLLAAGAKRNKRAYFIFFRPISLLKHNSNMSDQDKEIAIARLQPE